MKNKTLPFMEKLRLAVTNKLGFDIPENRVRYLRRNKDGSYGVQVVIDKFEREFMDVFIK